MKVPYLGAGGLKALLKANDHYQMVLLVDAGELLLFLCYFMLVFENK